MMKITGLAKLPDIAGIYVSDHLFYCKVSSIKLLSFSLPSDFPPPQKCKIWNFQVKFLPLLTYDTHVTANR